MRADLGALRLDGWSVDRTAGGFPRFRYSEDRGQPTERLKEAIDGLRLEHPPVAQDDD